MPRAPRIEYAHALHHVTNRGVEKRDIYLDDRDRIRFLSQLTAVISKTGWLLYAWVLMTNHYHLLVETPEPNLSVGMKDLDGDYASSFNVRHGRVGHLFQGRFKNQLVDSDGYLLELARYIVLNPVRAGIVAAPAEWAWSSYRATAGLCDSPGWLSPEAILSRFHPHHRAIAVAEYCAFVDAGIRIAESPWRHLVAGTYLGGRLFRQRVAGLIASDENQRRRALTLDDVAAALQLETSALSSSRRSRAAFVLLAQGHTKVGLAAIGRALGITGPGAAYLLKWAERLANDDAAFAHTIAAATARLEG